MLLFIFCLLQAVASAGESFKLATVSPSPFHPEYLQEMEIGRNIIVRNLWRSRFAIPILMHVQQIRVEPSTFLKLNDLREVFPLLMLPTLPRFWDFDKVFGQIDPNRLINATNELTPSIISEVIVNEHKNKSKINFAKLANTYGLLQTLCLIEEMLPDFENMGDVFENPADIPAEFSAFSSLSKKLDMIALRLYSSNIREPNWLFEMIIKSIDVINGLNAVLWEDWRVDLYLFGLPDGDISEILEVAKGHGPTGNPKLIAGLLARNITKDRLSILNRAPTDLFEKYFTAGQLKMFGEVILKPIVNKMVVSGAVAKNDEAISEHTGQLLRLFKSSHPDHADLLSRSLFKVESYLRGFVFRRLLSFAKSSGRKLVWDQAMAENVSKLIIFDGIISGVFDKVPQEWQQMADQLQAVMDNPQNHVDNLVNLSTALYMKYPEFTREFLKFDPVLQYAIGTGNAELFKKVLKRSLNLVHYIPQVLPLLNSPNELASIYFNTAFSKHQLYAVFANLVPLFNQRIILTNEGRYDSIGSIIWLAKYQLDEATRNAAFWCLAQYENSVDVSLDAIPAYKSTNLLQQVISQSPFLSDSIHTIANQLLDAVIKGGIPEGKYWPLMHLLFEILPSAIPDDFELVKYLQRLYSHGNLMQTAFQAEQRFVVDHLTSILRKRVFSKSFLQSQELSQLERLVKPYNIKGTILEIQLSEGPYFEKAVGEYFMHNQGLDLDTLGRLVEILTPQQALDMGSCLVGLLEKRAQLNPEAAYQFIFTIVRDRWESAFVQVARRLVKASPSVRGHIEEMPDAHPTALNAADIDQTYAKRSPEGFVSMDRILDRHRTGQKRRQKGARAEAVKQARNENQ